MNSVLIYILVAVLSAIAALCTYIVVHKILLKGQKEEILRKAEIEAESIRKDKIFQAKEKFLQLKSEYEQYINEKNKQISQRLLNIKKAARAELAFWITGHIHNDLYDCVSDEDTSLQLISVLSDGYCYANAPTAAKMVPATDTEQAIDHVLISLDRREIRFTRIGAGEDRLYRY